jgi:hypothetical protein
VSRARLARAVVVRKRGSMRQMTFTDQASSRPQVPPLQPQAAGNTSQLLQRSTQ